MSPKKSFRYQLCDASPTMRMKKLRRKSIKKTRIKSCGPGKVPRCLVKSPGKAVCVKKSPGKKKK